MAAFYSFLYFAPSAVIQRASVASAQRLTQRPAIDFAELALRVRGAAVEFVLLLWIMMVVAFSALVLAGFLL
jgi:hypothetical protein